MIEVPLVPDGLDGPCALLIHVSFSLFMRFRPCWFIHDAMCLLICVLQTVRTIRRRRCYPPTWKRWVFFLFPGTTIATSAVALYAFVETEENYFYIHSIWHMLIAGSVGFLLPPRAKPDVKVTPLKRRRGCGYQLCVNEHEEMGLVDPAIITINSICTSWWRLMEFSDVDFYLPFLSFLWNIKTRKTKPENLLMHCK